MLPHFNFAHRSTFVILSRILATPSRDMKRIGYRNRLMFLARTKKFVSALSRLGLINFSLQILSSLSPKDHRAPKEAAVRGRRIHITCMDLWALRIWGGTYSECIMTSQYSLYRLCLLPPPLSLTSRHTTVVHRLLQLYIFEQKSFEMTAPDVSFPRHLNFKHPTFVINSSDVFD